KFFSSAKIRGIDGREIFPVLFLIRFLDFDNGRQLMRSGLSPKLSHQKDVFYEFLHNPRINWRKVVFLFAKHVLAVINKKSKGKDNKHPRCLIVDDSLLEKTGKKIELIGKAYDHVDHCFQLGMKMLTLGFNDGKTF